MEMTDATQIELEVAVIALGALAQTHRLNVFRELVKAGCTGIAAGVLAQRLNIPRSSLSFHLSTLKESGLITERREGRSIIYTAHFVAMHALVNFLLKDCCSNDWQASEAQASEAPPKPENVVQFTKEETS